MALSIGIRGAGVAGLSVARELLARDTSVSITIYDTRPRLPHLSRTFCFFRNSTSDSHVAPYWAWNRVRFKGRSFERVIDVSGSPYVMIRGEDFFSTTLTHLERSGVRCEWECGDVAVDSTLISSSRGTQRFDVVIDAAFDVRTAQTRLWQSFAGVWVSTDTDVFDPSVATLMDLQESSLESPVSFMYVLPVSRRAALIEHTTFSVTPPSASEHLEHCAQWIAQALPCEVQWGDREHGLIPMGLAYQKPTIPYTIGTRRGAVRPATGYAFTTIQEEARLMSEDIVRGRVPQARDQYPWWLMLGDTLFLRALGKAPHAGEALMGGLLSRADDAELISFLAGRAPFWQSVKVWWSAPKVPMMRALLPV